MRHEFDEQRDKHMQAMLFYKNYIQELFEYHESEKQKLTFEFEQKLWEKESMIEISAEKQAEIIATRKFEDLVRDHLDSTEDSFKSP